MRSAAATPFFTLRDSCLISLPPLDVATRRQSKPGSEMGFRFPVAEVGAQHGRNGLRGRDINPIDARQVHSTDSL